MPQRFFPGARARLGLVLSFMIAAPLAAQAGDKDKMKHDSMAKPMAHDSMAMMGHEMMPPRGSFSGGHGHSVKGSFEIVTRDGKQWVVLGADFALDGAPDPYVVISENEMGSGKGTINLGVLKPIKGTSSYLIPAGTDLGQYHQVLIWCKKYNVTLGQAELAVHGGMEH